MASEILAYSDVAYEATSSFSGAQWKHSLLMQRVRSRFRRQTAHILHRHSPLFAAPLPLAGRDPSVAERPIPPALGTTLARPAVCPGRCQCDSLWQLQDRSACPQYWGGDDCHERLKLATYFHAHSAEIAHRFREMMAQLQAPYTAVTLPAVVTTTSILAQA
jgi:hypothetical protein